MKTCRKCKGPGKFAKCHYTYVKKDGTKNVYHVERRVCNSCLYKQSKKDGKRESKLIAY